MSLSVNDYIKYDLYQVFLLTKTNFSLNALRKSFRKLALDYHPDHFPSNLTDEEKKEKMDSFLLINNGYTILSNDDTRKEYDEKREAYLNEEKGFGNLKSQFNSDKVKYTLSKEEIEAKREEVTLLFKKQMDEMNAELEKQALNNPINADRVVILSNQIDDINLLVSETVKPSDNFASELSNITQNRNIKIENDGTTDYNSLSSLGTNGVTEKYAFINEAFK